MPVLPIGGAATASAQTTQTLPRPTALGMQPIPRTPSGVMPTVARTNRTDITKPMPAMPDPNAIRTGERPTQPGIATPAVNGRRLPDPGAKTPPLDLRGGAKVVVGAGSRPLPKPAAIGEPGRMDPSTTKPPAPSVAVALELLAQQQWDAARVALSALAAQAPESKHVKALAAFAVGRQAQMEKRYDEARIELQRALMLDPDLAAAKAALGELFARRK
jgi:tetratricopeptide (TPR) repeat protein